MRLVPELQGSIESIAKEKCRLAAKQIGTAAITEDTALCFDAMGELPGPYIKWFLEELGHEGLNRMVSGWDNKAARAVCTIAYADGPDAEPIIFQGITRVPLGHVAIFLAILYRASLCKPEAHQTLAGIPSSNLFIRRDKLTPRWTRQQRIASPIGQKHSSSFSNTLSRKNKYHLCASL